MYARAVNDNIAPFGNIVYIELRLEYNYYD